MEAQEFKPLPDQPAPLSTTGPIAWLKENLFSSVFNIAVTVTIFAALLAVLPGVLDWLFFSANWSGTTQADCVKDGACWVFIQAWSQQIFYGSFPDDEIWRVNLSLLLLAAVIGLSFILPAHLRNKIAVPAYLLLPFVCLLLLDGSNIGLTPVSTDIWGGFSLYELIEEASNYIDFTF